MKNRITLYSSVIRNLQVDNLTSQNTKNLVLAPEKILQLFGNTFNKGDSNISKTIIVQKFIEFNA